MRRKGQRWMRFVQRTKVRFGVFWGLLKCPFHFYLFPKTNSRNIPSEENAEFLAFQLQLLKSKRIQKELLETFDSLAENLLMSFSLVSAVMSKGCDISCLCIGGSGFSLRTVFPLILFSFIDSSVVDSPVPGRNDGASLRNPGHELYGTQYVRQATLHGFTLLTQKLFTTSPSMSIAVYEGLALYIFGRAGRSFIHWRFGFLFWGCSRS